MKQVLLELDPKLLVKLDTYRKTNRHIYNSRAEVIRSAIWQLIKPKIRIGAEKITSIIKRCIGNKPDRWSEDVLEIAKYGIWYNGEFIAARELIELLEKRHTPSTALLSPAKRQGRVAGKLLRIRRQK